MREDHKALCHSVLDTMMRTNPTGCSLFQGPAIDALDSDNLKDDYRRTITEPRDFALIRRNIDSMVYQSISSFESDGSSLSIPSIFFLPI